MDKYNKVSDSAFGPAKVKALKNINKELDKQIEKQRQLQQEANKYVKSDKKEVIKAAADLGVDKPIFDEDGYIANIEQMKNQFWKQYDPMQKKWADPMQWKDEEAQSKYKEEVLDPMWKKFEIFTKWSDKYEDSLQERHDAEMAMLDAFISKANNEIEIINYKLSLVTGVREREIARFEKELHKLDDEAFSTAKRFAYLTAMIKANRSELNKSMNSLVELFRTGAVYKTNKNGEIKMDWARDENGKKLKNDDGEYYKVPVTVKFSDEDIAKMLDGDLSPLSKNMVFSDELINALESIYDIAMEAIDRFDEIKEIVDDEIMRTYNLWTEKFEKGLNLMEGFVQASQTYMNILDLLGGRTGMSAADFLKNGQAIIGMQLNTNRATWEQMYAAEADRKGVVDQIDEVKAHQTTQQRRYKKRGENIQLLKTEYRNTKNHIQELKSELSDAIKQKAANDEEIARLTEKRDRAIAKGKTAVAEKAQQKIDELKKDNKKLNNQIDSLNTEIASERKKKEELQKSIQDTRNKRNKNKENIENDQDEIDSLTETVEKLDQEIIELKNNAVATLEETLKLIQDIYDQYFVKVVKEFEQSIAGIYVSFDNLLSTIDLSADQQEMYLKDYERIYELTKLNRDLEKKMDTTSNVKAKEKLRNLQEEILKYTKEGVKMSKYDLEYMQKKYDLEVAKIALEEAQNAKTQVRLTRDAEGNYSYTYTADENVKAEAQQNYEDKLNDILKLSNEYGAEMQKKAVQLEQEGLQAIANFRAYAESLKGTEREMKDDEIAKATADIWAQYAGRIQYANQEIEKAELRNMDVAMNEYQSYYMNTDGKIKISRLFTDTEIANFNTIKGLYEEQMRIRDQDFNNAYLNYLQHTDEADKFLASLDELQLKYEGALKTTLDNNHKLIDTEAKSAWQYYLELINNINKNTGNTAAGINGAVNGIILNFNSSFLPQWGEGAESASEKFRKFANGIYNPEKPNDPNTVAGQLAAGWISMNSDLEKALADTDLLLNPTDDETDPYKVFAKKVYSLLADPDNPQSFYNASKTAFQQFHSDVEASKGDVTNAISEVNRFYTESYPSLKKAKKAAQAVATAVNNILAAAANLEPIVCDADTDTAQTKLSGLITTLKNLKTAADDAKDSVAGVGSGTGEGGNGEGGDKYTEEEKLKIAKKVAASLWKSGTYQAGNWGVGDDRKKKLTEIFGSKGQQYIQGKITEWVNSGKIDSIANSYDKSTRDKWSYTNLKNNYKKGAFQKFDTGGYTGQWGTDGRWAMLHEKELILNKEDTANMLSAVKTVREIAAMVDLQAQSATLAGQYALALGNVQSSKNAQLDQNVHITAEFPNVQDHAEIELALTSLVNRASQYAWQQ